MRRRALLLALFLLFNCVPAGRAEIVKRKLGPAVNGPQREMTPIVSPDGGTLYFGREGYPWDPQPDSAPAPPPPPPASAKSTAPAVPPLDVEKMKRDGYTDEQIKQLEEQIEKIREMAAMLAAPPQRAVEPPAGSTVQHIWMSHRQADGSWGQAERLEAPLNTRDAPSAVYTALPDNNTLLVGGLFGSTEAELARLKGDQNFIAALTRRTATGWSQPRHLKFEEFQTTAPRNDFFLAPGGKVLLVSIENDDTVGNRDLYVSFLKDDGVWTRPKNLGQPVNTAWTEGGQVIAPDGVTVYYASNRPAGRGDYDIYMIRRLDDTWLTWTKPENLGPEINTSAAETMLSVDATGRLAFLASGPLMKEDLYEFALPEAVKPRPVALVRGRVHDPAGAPVAASILYELLRDGSGAGTANADPADGRYQIALPLGEDYGFLAEASGYLAVSEHVDLRQAKVNEVIERDLTLVPLTARQPIRLNNVFFRTDEAELLPESRRELLRLATLLRDHPTMTIEVAGHTDAQADDAYNLRLSEARAKAVVAFLVEAGIKAGRLQAKGYGETRPVASNDLPEGRAENRRVEFTILAP